MPIQILQQGQMLRQAYNAVHLILDTRALIASLTD